MEIETKNKKFSGKGESLSSYDVGLVGSNVGNPDNSKSPMRPTAVPNQNDNSGLSTTNQLATPVTTASNFQTTNIYRAFDYCKNSGIGEPSVYHALVVIILELFTWGLLTMPVITVLNNTFPHHTFLVNGLVMCIKGILSFLSAPLIGALSDLWGRKIVLLITVFFTCAPITLMTINTWWLFAMMSISGIFGVTFSVVFAYVADITKIQDIPKAFGLVYATMTASLMISPALGAYLFQVFGDTVILALATALGVLDVFFILFAVPESLPENVRLSSTERDEPFAVLRKAALNHITLMQSLTVLLSYLPEAGQFSCIFVYLKLKIGFSSVEVSIFTLVIGILSIVAQSVLGFLVRVLGAKRTILFGLLFETLQLLWYGFGSKMWMIWTAGLLGSLSSITYPAISAFVSIYSHADTQGVVLGMVAGVRGLCNSLGPAMFAVIFYLSHVGVNNDERNNEINNIGESFKNETINTTEQYNLLVPGPPFLFGAFMVVIAILVAVFLPEKQIDPIRPSGTSLDTHYEIERGRKEASPLSPLMQQDTTQL